MIVYPRNTVTYLRNNQALSWPGFEPATASHKCNVQTLTPPNHRRRQRKAGVQQAKFLMRPWSFVWDLCRHEIRGWGWGWSSSRVMRQRVLTGLTAFVSLGERHVAACSTPEHQQPGILTILVKTIANTNTNTFVTILFTFHIHLLIKLMEWLLSRKWQNHSSLQWHDVSV